MMLLCPSPICGVVCLIPQLRNGQKQASSEPAISEQFFKDVQPGTWEAARTAAQSFELCQSCELLGKVAVGAEVPRAPGPRAFHINVPGWVALQAGSSAAVCAQHSMKLSLLDWRLPLSPSYQMPSVLCVCHPPTGTSSRARSVGSLAGAIPDQSKVSSHLVPATQHWPEGPHWPCPAPSMPHVILQMPLPAFIPPLLPRLCTPHPQLLWAWLYLIL